MRDASDIDWGSRYNVVAFNYGHVEGLLWAILGADQLVTLNCIVHDNLCIGQRPRSPADPTSGKLLVRSHLSFRYAVITGPPSRAEPGASPCP
jgi:hypothetical protein